MQHRTQQKPRKVLAALVLTGVAVAFAIAWLTMSTPGWAQGIPSERILLSPYDQNSPTITVPSFRKGTLFLSQVKKPVEGATSTTEISRQVIADNVYRLADVNRQTGKYLYQTIEGSNRESVADVVTWLGDAYGKVIRVYTGGGYVKLSPGSSYIAATDENGVLRIIDVKGEERAVLEKATYAVFSPDGGKLAFLNSTPYSVGDAGGISVIALSSGKVLSTYKPDGAAYVPLAFSEDSNTLYFAALNQPAQQKGDPSNQNRVDVYSLLISGGAVPQLITTGVQKLPYMDYSRVEYPAGPHLLVLSAEDSVWVVDVRVGSVRTFPKTVDALWVGAGNTLLAHSSDESTSVQSWNVLTAR
ncbi:MAG: WD40 repeat domain-containing protein [bacterium]|nr:WD40 repeat domain-containing protein [bacterium]MDO8742537.1 WD40 repeat domain-containing protein [bacterium]